MKPLAWNSTREVLVVSTPSKIQDQVDRDLANRGRAGTFMYFVAVVAICSFSGQFENHFGTPWAFSVLSLTFAFWRYFLIRKTLFNNADHLIIEFCRMLDDG